MSGPNAAKPCCCQRELSDDLQMVKGPDELFLFLMGQERTRAGERALLFKINESWRSSTPLWEYKCWFSWLIRNLEWLARESARVRLPPSSTDFPHSRWNTALLHSLTSKYIVCPFFFSYYSCSSLAPSPKYTSQKLRTAAVLFLELSSAVIKEIPSSEEITKLFLGELCW